MLSEIDSGERLVICGDLNGLERSEIDGFDSVHGGFGFGKRNMKSEMSLGNCRCIEPGRLNTWFKKERKLSKYEKGEGRNLVDYIVSGGS